MYRPHFGLNEEPFGLTPDPDYVYPDMQHQAALQALLRALEGGEGFIKVTGEVGTGKTLLCRRLMASVSASVVTVCLLHPSLSPVELLRVLAIELGVSPTQQDDVQSLHRQIDGALQHMAAQGHRVVCCVDEAHALPEASLEALRLLSNLETNKCKLIQFVLFGQPELDRLLRSPGLRSLASRIGLSVRLDGLAMPDVRRYLKHRLSVAGWQGHRVFSEGACGVLWRASRGVPRVLNVLAHQCLMRACIQGTYRVTFLDALMVCLARWRDVGPVTRRLAVVPAWQGDRP